MFPDATFIGSVFTMGMERLLLDMVLYVLAPMILLLLMTMAGQNISRVGSAGMDSSKVDGVSSKVSTSARK